MLLYGLVSGYTKKAVELYPTREKAEEALRDALVDEPSWADVLSVAAIEVGETTPN